MTIFTADTTPDPYKEFPPTPLVDLDWVWVCPQVVQDSCHGYGYRYFCAPQVWVKIL